MSDRALIVLGMHRSGTSALTGALRFLGVELGNHLLKASEANASGYWEHAGIVKSHDKIFLKLRSAWDDVYPLPDHWWELPDLQGEVRKINRAIARSFTGTGIWGLKDPRMCRLMPFWHQLLKQHGTKPYFLMVTRNPLEVAASLARRDQFSVHKSAMLWVNHLLEMEFATRGMNRVWIPYDRLLSDPEATFRRISATLSLKWPVPWPEAKADIQDFLNPGMRHHRAKPGQNEQPDHGFAMSRALELFHWVDREEEPTAYFARMDACREEWNGILDLPGEAIRSMRGQLADLARDIEIARQAHGIRDEREQSLRFEVQDLEALLQENGINVGNGLFGLAKRTSKWSRILSALRNNDQSGTSKISLDQIGESFWKPSHRYTAEPEERHHLSFRELIPEVADLTNQLTDSIYAFTREIVRPDEDEQSEPNQGSQALSQKSTTGEEAVKVDDSIDLIALLKQVDEAFRHGREYLLKHNEKLAQFDNLKSHHDDVQTQIIQARLNMKNLEEQVQAAKQSHEQRDKIESNLRQQVATMQRELEAARARIETLEKKEEGVWPKVRSVAEGSSASSAANVDGEGKGDS